MVSTQLPWYILLKGGALIINIFNPPVPVWPTGSRSAHLILKTSVWPATLLLNGDASSDAGHFVESISLKSALCVFLNILQPVETSLSLDRTIQECAADVVDALRNLPKTKLSWSQLIKSHLFPIACHLDVPLRGAYEGSFDEGDYWRYYRWPIGFTGD